MKPKGAGHLAEPLPLLEHGFFSEDNRQGLGKLLAENRPKLCVEIGVFLGLSAKFTAETIAEWGGHLFCVDPWGMYEQLKSHAWISSTPYEQFLSNMQHWGLSDYVTPLKMTSLEAAPMFDGVKLGLVYVDGFHSFDAVKSDIEAWWPHLEHGGIMCGDDIAWEGVKDGILAACETVGAELVEEGPHFWKLTPKGSHD